MINIYVPTLFHLVKIYKNYSYISVSNYLLFHNFQQIFNDEYSPIFAKSYSFKRYFSFFFEKFTINTG